MKNKSILESFLILGIVFIFLGFLSAWGGVTGYSGSNGNLISSGLLGASLILSGSLFLYGYLTNQLENIKK